MASLRSESNNARDEAREHAAKGTEAAKESAREYKGAVQKEGLAAMKGAEDRYESAKEFTREKSGQVADSAKATKDSAVEYTSEKSGEVADSAKATKDSAVDNTVRAKDSVADTASQYAGAAKEKLAGLKDGVLHSFHQTKDSANETAENVKDAAADKYNRAADYTADATQRTKDTAADKYNKAADYTQDASQRTKDSAAGTYKAGQDSFGYGKDNTYTYIEEARRNLDQASKSISASTRDGVDTVSRRTGETVEGAEQAIGDYAGAAKDKALGAWDTTKQKAGELTGAAQEKKEEAKDSAGRTVDATAQKAGELTGAAQEKKEGAKDSAGRMVDATAQKAGELTGTAQEKKEEAKDSAGRTVDATKQKAGDVAGAAQEKKEAAKGSVESTWEDTKNSVAQTWDATKQKASELTGVAQDKKEETKDRAGSTWDATKQKAGEVAGSAQEKKEATKDSAGSTWESAKENAGQTWDATKQKAAETRDEAAAAADSTRDRSYDAAGATKEQSATAWEQMKQKASNLLGGAQHKTNETADAAQRKANETGDHAASTWDATKKSVSDTTEDAENKLSSTWQSTKDKASEVADDTKHKVGDDTAHEQKRGPLINLQGLKEKFLGGHHEDTKPSEAAGAKQTASQLLEAGKNEIADTFGETQDRNALSESTAGVTHPGAKHAGSVWDSTKDKAGSTKDDAAHEQQRRGPLIDLQGLKGKASQFLGGHHEDTKPSGEAGAKQSASQFLEAGKNETADTFGETQDRNALSESTAGVTHPGATHAGSVWDSTKDKSAHSQHGPELNWADIKQKASQLLEGTKNEMADTVNDSADRKTLSESTLGATQAGAHGASHPMDPTYAKTKSDDYHTPAVAHGVDWKEKAAQILQSFGNETADTFDTVQDRNPVAELTSAKARDPVASNVQDALEKAKTLQQEVRDEAAEAARRDDHAAPVQAGGLTWDSLKQKATSVLDSIQHASQNAADSAHEQAEKGAHDQNYSATEAAMRKAADIAGVASDRASTGAFQADEPVFTSETRRATADQVADYAAK